MYPSLPLFAFCRRRDLLLAVILVLSQNVRQPDVSERIRLVLICLSHKTVNTLGKVNIISPYLRSPSRLRGDCLDKTRGNNEEEVCSLSESLFKTKQSAQAIHT